MSNALADIVMAGGSSVDIEKQVRLEGVISMRRSGLEKAKLGITTLEEVERVTTG
jgi:type IV pilus assembly protein PilB